MTGPTVPDEVVEAAAMALYESQREPEYAGSEYDWPNIDTGYDFDGEDAPDPEWLRDRYRADARVILAAAVPVLCTADENLMQRIDGLLSLIYYREFGVLTEQTKLDLGELMTEVQRITRRRPI